MKKIVMLAAVFVMFISGTAFASHPLISDDAGTVEKGTFQVELNGEISSDKETVAGSTTRTERAQIATTLSYGINDKLDFTLGLTRPWGSIDVDGARCNDAGSLDVGFNLKWQLYEQNGFSVAVKPVFGYSYAVNAPENDYSLSYGAGIVFSKEVAPLAFHLNIGYSYYDYNLPGSGRNSIWSFSGAAVYDLMKNSKLVADIGASSNNDRNVSQMPVFGLLGAIYTLTKQIDVSVGGKIGLTKAETDATGLFGLTLKF